MFLWYLEYVVGVNDVLSIPLVDLLEDVECVVVHDLFVSPVGVSEESMLAIEVVRPAGVLGHVDHGVDLVENPVVWKKRVLEEDHFALVHDLFSCFNGWWHRSYTKGKSVNLTVEFMFLVR